MNNKDKLKKILSEPVRSFKALENLKYKLLNLLVEKIIKILSKVPMFGRFDIIEPKWCEKHKNLSNLGYRKAVWKREFETCSCSFPVQETWYNQITDAYVTSLLNHNMGASTSPADDLEFTYLAVGTGHSTVTGQETQLLQEIHRATYTYRNAPSGGNKIIWEIYIDPDTANPNQTTVNGAGTNSLTEITVNDISGFSVGTRFEVETVNGTEPVTVGSIASNTITLDTVLGNAFTAIPQNGQAVRIIYKEFAVFRAGATITANSGSPVNRSLKDHNKDGKGTIVRFTLSYLKKS